MFAALTALATGILATIGLAAIVAIVACLVTAARRSRSGPPAKLPSGADAALWSIVEAVPDPRNHLALTRDMSGEVRITDHDRETAAAVFADQPKVERLAPSSVDLRDPIAAPDQTSSDPLTEDESLSLAGELFFSNDPRSDRL